MDTVQEARERDQGDRFIAWFNEQHGTSYLYVGRAGEAPDLLYRDHEVALRLELTEAYADTDEARFKWGLLRRRDNVPSAWAGVDPEEALARDISERIARKCINAYGPSCLLVVVVDPLVTSVQEFEGVLNKVGVPRTHSFRGVFVGGQFAWSTRDGKPVYRCWELRGREA